mmetsp:Transcript_32438/g.103815  ORF Transcript_32438/g.103815 Transcript_32438/m.103815 type:complete len:288 (+) Transcript_32438:415-1278(+)
MGGPSRYDCPRSSFNRSRAEGPKHIHLKSRSAQERAEGEHRRRVQQRADRPHARSAEPRRVGSLVGAPPEQYLREGPALTAKAGREQTQQNPHRAVLVACARLSAGREAVPRRLRRLLLLRPRGLERRERHAGDDQADGEHRARLRSLDAEKDTEAKHEERDGAFEDDVVRHADKGERPVGKRNVEGGAEPNRQRHAHEAREWQRRRAERREAGEQQRAGGDEDVCTADEEEGCAQLDFGEQVLHHERHSDRRPVPRHDCDRYPEAASQPALAVLGHGGGGVRGGQA